MPMGWGLTDEASLLPFYLEDNAMLYESKSMEELLTILALFRERQEVRFGEAWTADELTRRIVEALQKKQTEHFESVFGTMTPDNLQAILNCLITSTQSNNYAYEAEISSDGLTANNIPELLAIEPSPAKKGRKGKSK